MKLFENTFLIMIAGFLLLDESQAWKNNFFIPTRIDCDLQPELMSNYTCSIKPVSRTRKKIIMWGMLAKPVTKLFAKYQLYKRYNGWQPYFVDYSFEVCDYLKGKLDKGLNNIYYYIYKLIQPILYRYTNINHPCPYNGSVELYDVDVNKVDVPTAKGTIFPSGYYKVLVELREPNSKAVSTIIFQTVVKEIKN